MNLLLDKVELYVRDLLKNGLTKDILYHTLDHTLDVVSSAQEIGNNSGLSSSELEIVLIAAWFHDSGYIERSKGHEESSVEIFKKFAEKEGVGVEIITGVTGCILATRMPQSPQNKLEQVICDADLLHLGKDEYFEKSSLLCKEMRSCFSMKLTDSDWMKMNKSFIEEHRFFTDYARKKYRKKKMNNLRSVINKLKSYHR